MKQILQYIWIEKYGCIENQEFNFTNRIRFHYDQEKQMITAEENDEYYSNFFGTNTEFTCVVGQNGTGKTTLLRVIKKVFAKAIHDLIYTALLYLFSLGIATSLLM